MSSSAGAEIRYDPATDQVVMPSRDFRDFVAIKRTAQEQVAVLNDELATARSERDEAMDLNRLATDINTEFAKENTRLRRDLKKARDPGIGLYAGFGISPSGVGELSIGAGFVWKPF